MQQAGCPEQEQRVYAGASQTKQVEPAITRAGLHLLVGPTASRWLLWSIAPSCFSLFLLQSKVVPCCPEAPMITELDRNEEVGGH